MLENTISKGSFDNKGSLINQKKMFADLMNYVDKTYAGGMENLSRTTTGMISTIKGIYSSFTNLLFTGSETGLIADKSPLGVFRNEVLQPLADNMIKWQKDGTFTKWSENFAKSFTKFYNVVKKGAKFLWENREAVLALMGGYLAFKTALTGISIFHALTNPLGLATLAVATLAGAFIYFYRNSENFRNVVKAIGEFVTQFLVNPIDTAKKSLEGYMMMLKDLKNWGADRLNKAQEVADRFNRDRENERNANITRNINTTFDDWRNQGTSRLNTKVVQPVININGGDTAQVRKVVEDVIFENEIRSGAR